MTIPNKIANESDELTFRKTSTPKLNTFGIEQRVAGCAIRSNDRNSF